MEEYNAPPPMTVTATSFTFYVTNKCVKIVILLSLLRHHAKKHLDKNAGLIMNTSIFTHASIHCKQKCGDHRSELNQMRMHPKHSNKLFMCYTHSLIRNNNNRRMIQQWTAEGTTSPATVEHSSNIQVQLVPGNQLTLSLGEG